MGHIITHSQYYVAVKNDLEFSELRQECKIRKFVTDHLEFQYANVSYAAFAQKLLLRWMGQT